MYLWYFAWVYHRHCSFFIVHTECLARPIEHFAHHVEHFIEYNTEHLIYRTVLSILTVLRLAIPRVYTGRGVDFRSLQRQQ